MGLEPTTPGTTIRCSNQLSYTHHVCPRGILITDKIGTPEGTRTPGLLLRRQLLYPTELLAQIDKVGAGDGNRTRIPSLEGWCPGHCATPACPPKIVSSHMISYDLVPVKEKIRKVVKMWSVILKAEETRMFLLLIFLSENGGRRFKK